MERSPARHSPTRQHPDAAAERQPSSDGDDGEAAAKAVASYLTVFDFSAVKGNPRGTANAVAQPISPRWVAVTLVALLLLYALVEVVVVQPMEEEERLAPPEELVGTVAEHPARRAGTPAVSIMDLGIPGLDPILDAGKKGGRSSAKRYKHAAGTRSRHAAAPMAVKRHHPDAEWDTFDEGSGRREGSSRVVSPREDNSEESSAALDTLSQDAILRSQLIVQGSPRTVMHHSPSIAQAADGHLLAVWFGGLWEAQPDASIWLAHLEEDGEGCQGGDDGCWGTPLQVAPAAREAGPCWNPVLCVVPGSGELLLFYKVGQRPQQWTGKLMRSSDSGRSWGEPESLPHGYVGPAKNKCLFTADGTLLAPASMEAGGKGSGPHARWTSHIEYSRDTGRTWNRTADIVFPGKIIQPSLVLDSHGRVRALIRQRGRESKERYFDSHVVMAVSDSSGLNWPNPAVATNLPCPNTGIDAVRLPDGRLLIAFNDSTRTRYAARRKLMLAVSGNDGLTWRRVVMLEHEAAIKEFSYPAVILASDGLVHVVYTWSRNEVVPKQSGRENIKHAVIDPARLA